MYFVIHTTRGQEEELIRKIKRRKESSCFEDVFIIKRDLKKKFNGKWNDVTERLFPGYIFVETEEPKKMHLLLNEIEGYSKVVGFKDDEIIHYIPLSEVEEDFIKGLAGKENDYTIGVSEIEVLEGKKIRVISGPLLGQEGIVKKVNLHKRVAEVEIIFLNQPVMIEFGIDICKGLILAYNFCE